MDIMNTGIFQSNTLFLEKDLNWKGILVEPNFKYFLQCIKNRPKSIIINCLLTSFENYKKKKYSYARTIYRRIHFSSNVA